MRCSYCDETATNSILRQVGMAPSNPKLGGTQADGRRQESVCFCALHWARLTAFLDKLS